MPVIREDFGHSFLWCNAGLDAHLNGHQLRPAPGMLKRLHSVFRSEPPHHQRQLTVGGGLDGSHINPLHVFRDGVLPRSIFTINLVFFIRLSLFLSCGETLLRRDR
jgi:hypothetical protein